MFHNDRSSYGFCIDDSYHNRITSKGILRLLDYFPKIVANMTARSKHFSNSLVFDTTPLKNAVCRDEIDSFLYTYGYGLVDFLADCLNEALSCPNAINYQADEDWDGRAYLYLDLPTVPWYIVGNQIASLTQEDVDEAFKYVLSIAVDDEDNMADYTPRFL